MSLAQCQIYVERTQKHKRAIPPELSFENVIQNKALPVRFPSFLPLPPFHSREKEKERETVLQLTISPYIVKSHVPYKISWTTSSTSRMMPKTFSSTSGYKITPKDSMPLHAPSKSFRRPGSMPKPSSRRATTRINPHGRRIGLKSICPSSRSNSPVANRLYPPSCPLNMTNSISNPSFPGSLARRGQWQTRSMMPTHRWG